MHPTDWHPLRPSPRPRRVLDPQHRAPSLAASLLAAVLLAAAPGCTDPEEEAGTLPDLASFTFKAAESATIKGDKSAEKAGSIPGCTGVIHPDDTLGNLALAAVFSQTQCYNDQAHTHGDYKVERGTLETSNGTYQLTAYRIHEPSRKATDSLGSEHGIFYNFPTKEQYTIYEFSDNALKQVAVVPDYRVKPGEFVRVSTLSASTIKGSTIYVFVAGTVAVNRFHTLGDGVEGARVARTALGDVLKYRYAVTATPFDTVKDYTSGPGSANNRYGQNRQFFFVGAPGKLALLWQDQSTGDVMLTTLGSDRLSATHKKLPGGAADMVLAAGCGGSDGSVYYFMAETGDGSPNTARKLAIYKVDSSGTLVKQASPSAAKSGGMNFVSFASSLKNNRFPATMRESGGKVALMIGRKMHQASDGLNHQGGIAVVFDAQTLDVLKNHGQTSGHSFGNVLAVNAAGAFVGIDLGDNYPRGIHLHRFDSSSRKGRVVYTFKTRHGTSAQNPAGKSFPRYDEASKGGTTYYQWSNDNDTYTELGGVVQTDEGYLVVFAGEREPLDNSKVGQSLNAARNVGFVLVREDFESASKGATNEVTDDLVKSEGAAETGGFYDFNGKLNAQRNKGVVWLTAYSDMTTDNASRLRAVPLPGKQVLLLWEKWSATAYQGTYALKVDHKGSKVGDAVSLGSHVRLGRRDEPLADPATGEVLLVSGDATEGAKKLDLVVIEP